MSAIYNLLHTTNILHWQCHRLSKLQVPKHKLNTAMANYLFLSRGCQQNKKRDRRDIVTPYKGDLEPSSHITDNCAKVNIYLLRTAKQWSHLKADRFFGLHGLWKDDIVWWMRRIVVGGAVTISMIATQIEFLILIVRHWVYMMPTMFTDTLGNRFRASGLYISYV